MSRSRILSRKRPSKSTPTRNPKRTAPRVRPQSGGTDDVRVVEAQTEMKAPARSKEDENGSRSHDAFGSFASTASNWLGSKWAFTGAVLIIVGWAASGPLFHFSDTW